MIGEIAHSTQQMRNSPNIPINEITQQISDEIGEIKRKLEQLNNALRENTSKQNTAILNGLQEFLVADQEKEATKKIKRLEARKQLAQFLKERDQLKQTTDAIKKRIEAGTRRAPYVIAGALALLIAYYCNLHTKFAELIGYKS
jgi:hypothetical protein